jgi:hypothetical protein
MNTGVLYAAAAYIAWGLFPWNASGRAIANGRDEGVTKLLFDDSPEAHGHGKILGGGMIGEVALAIEMGADCIDIGKSCGACKGCIHTHPAGTDSPRCHVIPPTPESAPPKRSPARYLWAVLIARIYEVFPLLCPKCGGQMRLIAFVTEGTQIRRILDHIGVDSEPPHISPARGPPLWEDCDAQTDDGAQIEPADWDLAAQPSPDYEI